ncbi:MAG: recombinase RecT [Alphaproteobacteria bacterium]|nr:recombinase RecT [Alphaproteobacteria bacterium]
MTSTELTLFEQQLDAVGPTFAQVAPAGVRPERIMRTIVIACDRTPKLLRCQRQSLMNAAITFGILGIEVDGVTGQGWPLPFGDRVQPVIGYKGYNTLAARSGYTIHGEVVREGDVFKARLGSKPEIIHEPVLGNQGRILGAYAVATSLTRPPIVAKPLGIEEILEVKARSPGARKSDSPWNDNEVGFPAMAQKTAMRRLQRSMPLTLATVADAMETLHEIKGTTTYIHPESGVQVEADIIAGSPTIEAPRWELIRSDGKVFGYPTPEQWEAAAAMVLEGMSTSAQARSFADRMQATFETLRQVDPNRVDRVALGILEKVHQLEEEQA